MREQRLTAFVEAQKNSYCVPVPSIQASSCDETQAVLFVLYGHCEIRQAGATPTPLPLVHTTQSASWCGLMRGEDAAWVSGDGEVQAEMAVLTVLNR